MQAMPAVIHVYTGIACTGSCNNSLPGPNYQVKLVKSKRLRMSLLLKALQC